MDLIWGIAAVVIYLGIIGILAKDVMDQIRRRQDDRKIIKKNKNNKHSRIRR